MVLFTIFIVTFLLALVYFFYSSSYHRNLPPFPARPVPLLGNLLNMSENPRDLFDRWRHDHGDVFSLYLGQTLVIVLNGFDAIKEGLVNYGNYFSDRPISFVDEATDCIDKGVIFSSGKKWEEQRALSISTLRSLGMGKNSLAEKIVEEASYLLDAMTGFEGQEVDMEPLLNMAAFNVISIIGDGKRRDFDDPESLEITENMQWIVANLRGTNPLNFYPSLYHLPGDLFKGKEIARRMSRNMDCFRRRYVVEKNYSQSEGEEPVCFVDSFIKNQVKSGKIEELSSDDEKNMVRLILDLYAAGTETSSTTILWCILYLLHFPEVQEKIYKEIDSKIGSHRLPTMLDKTGLPYLNAFIMEVQRIANVAPLSIMHKTSQTVTFRGYTIPKDANIAPNLDSVLLDPKVWGDDVKSFRPERHLNAQGKVVVREEFIPFSIGKRICLGEGLAKMELFLFLASLLQKFSFKPIEEGFLPSLKGVFGLTVSPEHFKVKYFMRG